MNKKLLLLFLFIVHTSLFTAKAQDKKMDSLNLVLQNAKQDSTRFRIYLALCDACPIQDNLKYAEPALKLADKLLAHTTTSKERTELLHSKIFIYQVFSVYYAMTKNFDKTNEKGEEIIKIYKELNDSISIIRELGTLNNYNTSIGNYPKALDNVQMGMDISKEMNYKGGIANCYFLIADLYRDQGELKLALENYQKAIEMLTMLKDTNSLVNVLSGLGGFYKVQKKYDQALECYQRAAKLTRPQKLDDNYCRMYAWMAEVYKEKGDYSNAIENYKKSLELFKTRNNLYQVKEMLDCIGMVYNRQHNFSKALDYHFHALDMADQMGDDYSKAWSYLRLARVYFKQKNLKLAKDYIERSLVIKKKQYRLKEILEVEQLASNIDSASGNGMEAYEHYKQYILLNEKLKGEEIHQAAQKEKFQKEYEQQKAMDKMVQEKKDALIAAETRKQKIVLTLVLCFLVLVLAFAGFVFRSLRIRNKQNKIITEQKQLVEEKQKEITDSIEYAKRIQYSLLAHKEVLDKNLTNYFVLFLPKDIVSGDFYWATEKIENTHQPRVIDNEIKNQETTTQNQFYLAVCDSTGHGVPGAFMSLLNINFLNEAINEKNIVAPNEIFNYVRKRLIENTDGGNDGMDATLIRFANNKITYASANNKPVLVSNNTIVELAADKMPVGKGERKESFQLFEIEAKQGDTVYFYTDGYADQFGGDNGEKKLTRKKFKELLLNIQHLSMPEQQTALEKFIIDYRKEIEQIDDILVMGVRV